MLNNLTIRPKTKEILEESFYRQITVEEAMYLMNLRGDELYALLITADKVRKKLLETL